MSEFTQKIAYVVPPPDPEDSEESLDDVDLESCKEGLQWMGFKQNEIKIILDAKDSELPDLPEKKGSEKILIFVYYKGPTNVANGFASCGEKLPLEDYARQCAAKPHVKVVILFDTCKRPRGRGGRDREVAVEGDPLDIVFVYRNCCKKRGCPCEQWSLPDMAADFFETLKERRLEGKG